MKIGKKIKELLKARGITQGKLSELTGFRQSDISDWVNDKHLPRSETLDKIADVLKVSISELVESNPSELSETDAQLLALSEEDKKLALDFVKFIHSKKYAPQSQDTTKK